MINTAAVSGFFVGVSLVSVVAILVLVPKVKERTVRNQPPGPGPKIRGGSPNVEPTTTSENQL